MMVTGSYNKTNGTYKMHAPHFPYDSMVYMGYTLKEMKARYREQYGLKGKHIEWIIVGL